MNTSKLPTKEDDDEPIDSETPAVSEMPAVGEMPKASPSVVQRARSDRQWGLFPPPGVPY